MEVALDLVFSRASGSSLSSTSDSDPLSIESVWCPESRTSWRPSVCRGALNADVLCGLCSVVFASDPSMVCRIVRDLGTDDQICKWVEIRMSEVSVVCEVMIDGDAK